MGSDQSRSSHRSLEVLGNDVEPLGGRWHSHSISAKWRLAGSLCNENVAQAGVDSAIALHPIGYLRCLIFMVGLHVRTVG